MTIGKKITLGYALPMAALFILSTLAYQSTTRLISTNELVDHTHKVLNGLDVLLSLVMDAETGQRGFLLTGNADYLQPYKAAVPKIDEKLAELRTLTADNENQQRSIDDLREPIAKKLAELNKTIELRKADADGTQGEGYKAVLKIVQGNEGKNLMEQIRGVIKRMAAEEKRLLAQRTEGVEQAPEPRCTPSFSAPRWPWCSLA